MPGSRTAPAVYTHGEVPHDGDRTGRFTCLPKVPVTHATLRADFDALLAESRPRLLRLARMNGVTADGAEDVVQEACLEAWRHLEQLQEPARFASWLDGICRNICRRHTSAREPLIQRARETWRETWRESGGDDAESASLVDLRRLRDPRAVDPADELDRQDRQFLLNRALGHLSPGARELVELCYLAELPQREVALQLGMSLGAVELRLHRARRHLHRVLSGALRSEAEAFGLLVDQDEAMGWRETRKWCPMCGKCRLRGTFEHRPAGKVALRLRCPDCAARHGLDLSGSGDIISFAGMRSLLPAIKRGMLAACDHFSTATQRRVCGKCQSPVRVRLVTRYAALADAPMLVPALASAPSTLLSERSFLLVACPRCGISSGDLATGLLAEPVARAFVVDRPRVLIEPDALAAYAGQDAIRSRLVDLETAERMTIIADPQTLQILATLRA